MEVPRSKIPLIAKDSDGFVSPQTLIMSPRLNNSIHRSLTSLRTKGVFVWQINLKNTRRVEWVLRKREEVEKCIAFCRRDERNLGFFHGGTNGTNKRQETRRRCRSC